MYAPNQDLDLSSALLIAQLQLDDAIELSQSRKGKSRAEARPSDEEIAFRLLSAELDGWKQLHRDAYLARSLNEAMERDGDILDAYRIMEEATAADRRAAEALSMGMPLPALSEAQIQLEDPEFFEALESKDDVLTDIDFLKKAKAKKVPILVEEDDLDWRFDAFTARSSKGAGPSVDKYKKIKCISCGDTLRVKEAFLGACDHYWCASCLKDLIEVYLRDESLHPLRCCKQALDVSDISAHLGNAALFAQFEAKRREYETPAQHRVYCSRPTCSAFLGSSVRPSYSPFSFWSSSANHTRILSCHECFTRTCGGCKKVEHVGTLCSENVALEQVRALAQQAGWQTCPGCSAVVELQFGCNHMTCRCRTEFCYVCGVRWKQCGCAQWDEARLEMTAQIRAEGAMGGEQVRVAQPEMFRREVERTVENLREGHGCVYHLWAGREGGICEECGDYLPIFLKRCWTCGLSVCRRCSLNRL